MSDYLTAILECKELMRDAEDKATRYKNLIRLEDSLRKHTDTALETFGSLYETSIRYHASELEVGGDIYNAKKETFSAFLPIVGAAVASFATKVLVDLTKDLLKDLIVKQGGTAIINYINKRVTLIPYKTLQELITSLDKINIAIFGMMKLDLPKTEEEYRAMLDLYKKAMEPLKSCYLEVVKDDTLTYRLIAGDLPAESKTTMEKHGYNNGTIEALNKTYNEALPAIKVVLDKIKKYKETYLDKKAEELNRLKSDEEKSYAILFITLMTDTLLTIGTRIVIITSTVDYQFAKIKEAVGAAMEKK